MITQMVRSASPAIARANVAASYNVFEATCRDHMVEANIERPELIAAVARLERTIPRVYDQAKPELLALVLLERRAQQIIATAKIMLDERSRFASPSGRAQRRALAAVIEVMSDAVAGLKIYAPSHPDEVPILEGPIFDTVWTQLATSLTDHT